MAMAAVLLGALAFRFAHHEAEYRKEEVRKHLRTQTKRLAEQCLGIIRQEEINILKELRKARPAIYSGLALQRKNPLFKEIFITDSKGCPLFPEPDSSFFRRYSALFYEVTVMSVSTDDNDAADIVRRETSAKKSISKLSKAAYNQQAQKAEPQQIRLPRKTAAKKALSPFASEIQKSSAGWIPWFAENKLCPIVWARSEPDDSKIVGAELETVALLSMLIPIFSQEPLEYYRFELADSHGKMVYGTGFQINIGDNDDTHELTPVAVETIAPDMLPNWQVRGYLSPSFSFGKDLALANLLQISTLLLVIFAGAGMLFWIIRREFVIAGQKTTFVANVSHELKTPLTSIRMYSELLLSKKKKTPAKEKKYLSIILSESERLSRLISNVLDFSKMEAGEKKYNAGLINLNELVREIAETHGLYLTEKNIELKLQLPDENITVSIDRDSLIQVIQNLLSNAVKYAADGKEITISVINKENTAEIKIMDRGKGVPVSSRKKLFRKFYRGDDSLTAETRGSGLGLSIARGLMRDQGGDLTYAPREGGGSVFRVSLDIS